MAKRRLIYPAFERFWHWAQALLVLILMLTGFEIHGSLEFFGFDQAVRIHIFAAYAFLVLIAFAIFWHFTTGEWRQYVPTLEKVKEQAHYYLVGIFQNAPHPTKKTALSKLNPLQKIVYAGLKIVIIPTIVVSGLLYLLYRFPQRNSVGGVNIHGLGTVAVIHTIGAFALVVFLLGHLYLMTTGKTVFSNLKAMITGYEDEDEDAPEAAAVEAKAANP